MGELEPTKSPPVREAGPVAADLIDVVRRLGPGMTSDLVARRLCAAPSCSQPRFRAPESPVDLRARIEERAEPTAERAT